ncbi:MAG TPA: tRNA (adenosine(37)-N6)-threonylcarbamoyltransferase complex transferase subunit TsaD [Patescibacteria group bacterium]|nr:tRNA (adenosine(37)-N6)-threonylcarbamoyltransferase complex transferase subunit TsaD [Patescibacteria group bacterium]
MLILGIETSCDETSAAVLEFKNGGFRILGEMVASSVELQAQYGGIVPEVAARAQMEYMMPVLEQVNKAKGKRQKAKVFDDIDYIAVTNGPGLITSLRVGVEAARTLSYIWNRPLIAVNHLEGHIYSALLSVKQSKNQKSKIKNQNYGKLSIIKFPAVALVVSGGHTELVLMKDYNNYKIVGQTLDDAVGEAFDKVAKILDLGYPGGPIISELAAAGDKTKYNFPRPMIKSGDFNFSFAGLKTAVLYKFKTQNSKLKIKDKKDMCASFQEACVEILAKKTIKAAEKYKVKTMLLGGGVAANGELRKRLGQEVDKVNLVNKVQKGKDKIQLLIPELKYTGDNAVMIALAGYFKVKKTRKQESNKLGRLDKWKKVRVDPNLGL